MSGALEHHVSPQGLTPGTGYSHVVSAAGRSVVVSGQVALDDQGEVVGADDARVQSEKVFENLGLALAAGGAAFADVVKLTYFVLDVAILPTVREVRDRMWIRSVRRPAQPFRLARCSGRISCWRSKRSPWSILGSRHQGRDIGGKVSGTAPGDGLYDCRVVLVAVPFGFSAVESLARGTGDRVTRMNSSLDHR